MFTSIQKTYNKKKEGDRPWHGPSLDLANEQNQESSKDLQKINKFEIELCLILKSAIKSQGIEVYEWVHNHSWLRLSATIIIKPWMMSLPMKPQVCTISAIIVVWMSKCRKKGN